MQIQFQYAQEFSSPPSPQVMLVDLILESRAFGRVCICPSGMLDEIMGDLQVPRSTQVCFRCFEMSTPRSSSLHGLNHSH